uniref:Germ cell nuclear acidic peptidase n=1 Tax=Neogobius melanostomus TaxID=47308 RepID=A0A8C6TAN7_9GOBI
MDNDTCKLFERVAKKMGWMAMGGLEVTEAKLISTIGKSRHPGTSDAKRASSSLSDSDTDDNADKENLQSQSKNYRLNAPIVSSDDDDFEHYRDFVVMVLFFFFFSPVPKKSHTPSQALLRRPLPQCDSPVFVSDSDDEEDKILIKSTWKTRQVKPQPSSNKKQSTTLRNDDSYSPSVAAKPSSLSLFSTPSRLDDSASSEEEFTSLLDRLKKKNILQSGTASPALRKGKFDCTLSVGIPTNGQKLSDLKLLNEKPHKFITPICMYRVTLIHLFLLRVPLCKTPGCFLEMLSNPENAYGRNFKQNKEELTSRLFRLYNASVFDGKLPESMSLTWNKKMRKTAGYCITGQERGGGNRYARIELSEKVCDSADRLRDTLIHELCHAATWLINGVRDGHGNFWKLYARKSTVVHPELPMVTRCHSYDIKYKFQYQCTRCQNTIGRHSKSLNTERFVCALCTGKLVLLNPSNPRTPTPFANFVKANYGATRQELVGQSHGDVMRKLSADFALKTKLSQAEINLLLSALISGSEHIFTCRYLVQLFQLYLFFVKSEPCM